MECMALLTSQLEKQKQYWEAKVYMSSFNTYVHDTFQLANAQKEMEEKNRKLSEKIESFQSDFVTRNEFGKEKSNFERKIKSTIEKNIKVQKELDAERDGIIDKMTYEIQHMICMSVYFIILSKGR